MESTIDLYGISRLKEFYIPVEFELELTPDYFHKRKTAWRNNFDWFHENDPYFKWVINYITLN